MMHTDNLAKSAPEGVEPVSAENSVTIGREDLHPARNIHHLVDAFLPTWPHYHPTQPYMKEDDENV